MNTGQLSLVIIAANEERNLGGCLASAAGLGPLLGEVVLIDDSRDEATTAVARVALAAFTFPPELRVFRRRYDGQARQTNFALEQARGQWLLLLDADERMSAAMRADVRRRVAGGEDCAAVFFPRRNIVFGRWLRHGGNYPDYNHARLLRRGRVEAAWRGDEQSGPPLPQIEGRPQATSGSDQAKSGEPPRFGDRAVHARLEVAGPAAYSRAPLLHHSYPDLRAYFDKFNRYTTSEALDMAAAGRRYSTWRMWTESLGHLAQRGVRGAAFLDGVPGVTYLGLGFAYDLVRHWKLRELREWGHV